jgi:hypothetical protein
MDPTGGPPMPSDFTPGWPPDDATWLAVRDRITAQGNAAPKLGRHCAVEIWRTNPISGYRVKVVKVPDQEVDSYE